MLVDQLSDRAAGAIGARIDTQLGLPHPGLDMAISPFGGPHLGVM